MTQIEWTRVDGAAEMYETTVGETVWRLALVGDDLPATGWKDLDQQPGGWKLFKRDQTSSLFAVAAPGRSWEHVCGAAEARILPQG